MTARLSGINIYPIKSARGIALSEWETDTFGLRYDRRWMVVDGSGRFITQRNHPRMALVTVTLGDGVLRIDAPGMPTLETPLHPVAAVLTQVVVWDFAGSSTWLGEEAALWFSRFLGTECSLVHMGDDVVRPANPLFAPEATRVSFADGYPILLISEESLADLNHRLSQPLHMNRFRPNLVVSGAKAYAEDEWKKIQIGGMPLRVVKPCFRCAITTTDQITGERGREPLRTLATYRKVNGEVMFGQNVVHETTGKLRLGDPVLIR
ncbi:MAG TPA: MOSC N-terminal beta barrel domain-containing protein [Gemmatimonadales bacterium]|nr:MOSC N-terminal beta barrel domain-containing protein [Gemmatimonadales bacterium]